MPRPKLDADQRRTRKAAVGLTGPESRAVREAARRRSMRVSAFIRDAALTAAVEALGTGPEQIQPDPHTVAATVALRREIRRLGSNLNQAVALAHRGGNPDLQAAVEELRAAVVKVLER